MAIREVYIGSVGPFLYDDVEPMPGEENEVDPVLQKAINAEDQEVEVGYITIDSKLRADVPSPGTDKVSIFRDIDNGYITLRTTSGFFQIETRIKSKSNMKAYNWFLS